MPGFVVSIDIESEQGLRVPLESGITAVDEVAVGASVRQRQPIEAAGEDGLDRAI